MVINTEFYTLNSGIIIKKLSKMQAEMKNMNSTNGGLMQRIQSIITSGPVKL